MSHKANDIWNEAQYEGNPYSCFECNSEVDAPTWKFYDGHCRACAKSLRGVDWVLPTNYKLKQDGQSIRQSCPAVQITSASSHKRRSRVNACVSNGAMKKHKHTWEKEIEIKTPNFIGRLFGQKEKRIWLKDSYFCRCGARGIYLFKSLMFVQEQCYEVC